MGDWNVVGVLHHYGVHAQSLSGDHLKCWCPFHDDTRPSLSVWLKMGTFYCFGCGWKGDVFDFVRAMEGGGLDGTDLLLRTMEVSLSTEYRWNGNGERRKFDPASLRRFVDPDWSRVSGKARYIVEKRGVAPEVLKLFRVLWDPQRQAVIFPVLWEGRWVGYQARFVVGESNYVFAVGTPRVLYYSREYGVEPEHPLLVVEGVIDALKAVTYGWTHVAATFGTSFSASQLEFLSRFQRVLVCMDNDAAGHKAARELLGRLGGRVILCFPIGGTDVGDMDRKSFWKTVKHAWEGRDI